MFFRCLSLGVPFRSMRKARQVTSSATQAFDTVLAELETATKLMRAALDKHYAGS